MTVHWPQLIYIALTFISLGITLSRHGEPKTGTHSIFADLIAVTLIYALLFAGGFFGG